jgi:chemotaxis protein methyltransferase CheR
MTRLEDGEWKALADYIYSICGIHLDQSKSYLIESRLSELLRPAGVARYGELPAKARADSTGALERRIIDAITTGETSFFRDQSPFDLLRHKLIPELIDSRMRRGMAAMPIRIWSAACSTGQELYSIGITLRELFGPSGKYDIRLVGTDISPHAVARASRAVYNVIEIGRGIPEALLARYFTREHDGWKVRDEVRALASFRSINLLRDFSFLGQFDIIFCRNVAIYFNAADKAALFGRMEKALAPEGCLIIGGTESLSGICPGLEAKRHVRAVYYQRTQRPLPDGRPATPANGLVRA